MSTLSAREAALPPKLDYSLTGENATRAVEMGLAEADWYQTPVPRETMRRLLERRDAHAIRDTLIWFGLIIGAGYVGYLLWGSWWCLIPFAVYGVLYASTSDSRWHESGHGTAFKTDWMNNALYEIASFMVMRESVVWRWSHTRHHSDTIIVGRDPEISVPRPPDLKAIALGFLGLRGYLPYFRNMVLHALGRMTADEKTFIPDTEFPKIHRNARIYLAIYLIVLTLCAVTRSVLPLLYVGLPSLYGSWLMRVYSYTQHAGLAENVLDHRLNCRTVYMNRINRFLYWNMNYHIEHHMFPLVPYHALPALHDAVRTDMPAPYPSLWEAWKEIVPTILRQVKDPTYHVKRSLPETPRHISADRSTKSSSPDREGWIEVCPAKTLRREDVIRFDLGQKTFALYRDDANTLFATDGICTHGNTHLSDGLVKGRIIECPKHNGRFNLADGTPARAPICRGLATYPVEEREGRIYLNVSRPGGAGAREQQTIDLRVVSNHSVATFVKELVLEPMDATEKLEFAAGDYLQFKIPTYEQIPFAHFDIPDPYRAVWQRHRLFDLIARNPEPPRRNNYSLANNPALERLLRFNIRIATPPPGQDCSPGIGSSYMFNLKPGDAVTATGPFGDFHIKPTQREMVYIGGGAGMAPLRAHLSHLLETDKTARKVSFWYGARSAQEIFYRAYFEQLQSANRNFSFHLALSSPLPEDHWNGHVGFIHDVVWKDYLREHRSPTAVEYYLCGPPMMIRACKAMLSGLNVAADHIAYDEF